MKSNYKLLGVDYGNKKVGLAIGDTETRVASPFLIIINGGNLLAKIRQICIDEKIEKIVVGLPVGLTGVQSPQYLVVKKFIAKLKNELTLEIFEQDENLSSSYAKKLLQGTKSKGQDDDVAAMIILQSYLDKIN